MQHIPSILNLLHLLSPPHQVDDTESVLPRTTDDLQASWLHSHTPNTMDWLQSEELDLRKARQRSLQTWTHLASKVKFSSVLQMPLIFGHLEDLPAVTGPM